MMARILALLALVQAAIAWSAAPNDATKKVRSAGAAAAVAAAVVASPLISQASVFDGSYSDPNHPNCIREITSKGPEAQLYGTDGNPGCPADGSGNRWQLTGKIDGKEIFVDFSPKGGPKDLKGVFDGSGINWPDGNKWTLKSS